MNRTRSSLAVIAAAALLTLAACGSGSDTASTAPAATSTPPGSTSSADSAGAGLTTASTSLGTVVVDPAGRTVYVFDSDKQGAASSACTGGCAREWPAVPAGSAGSGVTGAVGSITGVDGKAQATLDGWPLYYFAGDKAAGDVKGQGVGGIWWVVTPDGAKVTAASASDASSDASSGDSSGVKGGY